MAIEVPITNIKTVRADFLEDLNNAGIKAVAYDTDRIIPPVAIVVPDESYVRNPAPNQRMGQWNIGISILLIASKGTGSRNADELDDLIQKVLLLLPESVDVDNVSGPGKVKVAGSDYLGSIISVQYQIKLKDTP